ncbi:MAG: ABC transporter ATP-binding protein [Elusimicrobia bacterium]|nr:ABC transporter ATP-binding protein [Elusimicrobiota bacterium]
MIEIKNLKKSFGQKQVLKGVNISVDKGEILTVVGGSGCGKSTFIKCIVRLLKPDSGSVKIDGEDISKITDEYDLSLARRDFGYLFQEGALFDSMSVAENVSFGLKYLTDIPRKEHVAIASQKLELVGLKGVENLRPSELSGGMKKRVALARAIAAEPRYIFYDEPTSGLDPIMSDIINELIMDMREKLGITSIVITHDITAAFKISDKMAMLYEGDFIMTGTPKEFKATDNPYVRQFVDGSSHGPIQMKIRDL